MRGTGEEDREGSQCKIQQGPVGRGMDREDTLSTAAQGAHDEERNPSFIGQPPAEATAAHIYWRARQAHLTGSGAHQLSPENA